MARYGTRSSSKKMLSNESDEITPCTVSSEKDAGQHPSHEQIEDMRQSRSPSPSSCSESGSAAHSGSFEKRRNSIKTIEEGTEGDPERLWKRMLVLQQIYGCYRSARMSAALELGDSNSLLRRSNMHPHLRRRILFFFF